MKIKNIIKISLFVFSISIMFNACQWITIEPVITENPDDPDNPDGPVAPVSLAHDLQPIFNSKCAACHTSRSPVLTSGSAYNSLTTGGFVDILNPGSSKIVVKVNTGHGLLTPSQKAKLLQWVQEGAKNN